MLRHIGEDAIGRPHLKALGIVLADDKVRTRDLGGTASTTEFTAAICRRLAA